MSALTPNSQRYVAIALISESKLRTVSMVCEMATGQAMIAHQFHIPPGVSPESATERMEKEAALLSRIQHPNIPRCVGYQFTPTGHWMLFEFLEGCRLSKYEGEFDKVSDQWIVWWLHQMLVMLDELHKAGIVIGGLEPKHFLVSETRLFLVHVGLLEHLFPEALALTRSPEGLLFTAPEHRNSVLSSISGDLFSVGAIAYWLATGTPPTFSTKVDEWQVMADIVKVRKGFSESVCSVISSLLKFHANARYQSADEALDALVPWVPVLEGPDAVPPPLPASITYFGEATMKRYAQEAEKIEHLVAPDPIPPPPALPAPPPEAEQWASTAPPPRSFYDRWLWYAFRRQPLIGWGTVLALVLAVVMLPGLRSKAGSLKAAVAHPVPLTVVSGHIEVLNDRTQSPEPADAVTTLNAQMTAMGSEDAALSFGLGSRVRVAGQTMFEYLRSPSANQLRLSLSKGHAWFEPTGQDTVEVTVPTGVIRCFGGSALEVSVDDTTTVTATTGTVRVQSSKGTSVVHPGTPFTMPDSHR